jgi:hypothetical protein
MKNADERDYYYPPAWEDMQQEKRNPTQPIDGNSSPEGPIEPFDA